MQLAAALTPYPNLHLMDLYAEVANVLLGGVTVGTEKLTPAQFDGLLSLDGLHFTDTGYGILANVLIAAMNPVLHSQIPHVDLAAVLAQDPLSPSKLRRAGFTCVPPP